MPTWAPFQSNTSFQLAGTLTSIGTSVNISAAIEDGRTIDAEDASVVLTTRDGKTIERMICDIENGVMSIVQRGLDFSDTPTTDTSLQKEWRTGTRAYITTLAFNLFNSNNNTGQTQTIAGDVTFTGEVDFTGPVAADTIEADIVRANQELRSPKFADSTARDAAIPSPIGGEVCQTGSVQQYYNGTTLQWEDIDTGTPTPNAEEGVAGIVDLATLAQQGAGDENGIGGSKLVLQSKNTAKTPDATPSNDENKVPVLDSNGRLDSFVQVKKWQQGFVAGEALSSGDLVYVDTSDGKVYLTESTDSSKTQFIGFSNEDVSADDDVVINTGIADDNQSGLTVGDMYYLDKSIEGYDVSTAVYNGQFLEINPQDNWPLGICFGNDGLNLYVAGNVGDDVYQYDLANRYSMNGAVYSGNSISIAPQDSSPGSPSFSEDGFTMWVIWRSTEEVYQYVLSTAWDLSTASYDSKSFDLSNESSNPRDLSVRNGGTKMYILDFTGTIIYQYTLSTPNDISTASYDSVSYDASAQSSNPNGIFVSEDGTKLVIADNALVYEYDISTPYDISTSSYTGNSYNPTEGSGNPNDVAFDPNGQRMFVLKAGGADDDVYEYDLSFTYSSVPGAITSSPATPLSGQEENILVGQATSGTTIQFETLNTNNISGEYSNTATPWTITPGDIEGYITVKINGEDKKIAYYGV